MVQVKLQVQIRRSGNSLAIFVTDFCKRIGAEEGDWIDIIAEKPDKLSLVERVDPKKDEKVKRLIIKEEADEDSVEF